MFDVIVVSLKTTKGLVFASCVDDLDLKVGDVVIGDFPTTEKSTSFGNLTGNWSSGTG